MAEEVKSIIFYSQPNCPQCRMIHMLADNKGIKYTEVQDIDLMKSKGISHTPAFEVDGVVIQGRELFDYIKTGQLPDSCASCDVK